MQYALKRQCTKAARVICEWSQKCGSLVAIKKQQQQQKKKNLENNLY